MKFILKRCHLRSVAEWRENNIAIQERHLPKSLILFYLGLAQKSVTDTLLHREDFKLINDQVFLEIHQIWKAFEVFSDVKTIFWKTRKCR